MKGTLLIRVSDPISLWVWGDSPGVEKAGEASAEHQFHGGIVNKVEDPSSGFLTAIADACDHGALMVVEHADIPGQDADGHSVVTPEESSPELVAWVAKRLDDLAAQTAAYLEALDQHRLKAWMSQVDDQGDITDEGRSFVDAEVEKAAAGLAKKAGLK